MPSPSGLPAVGDEIAGKYRIEAVLGQGGMGAVFSAQNTLTGKRVAIKWLLPEQASATSRERLLREARIAASIEHPNVVDIYDIGEHDGGLFLVMEYLRGPTLGDVLAERGRLDPQELISMLVPVMRGVHFAHQGGIVHRDLKPENIILSEVDGQVVPKVLDFGVSKAMSESAIPHSTLTRTGALVGTPHYMALEQVDGTGAIDARTDVYAFGVIFYRALTGHYPFDGSSLGEVILKIGTKDPQPMRFLRAELSADLEAVILRAILRQRSQRYASVEEFARALEPFAPGVRFRDSNEPIHRSNTGASSRDLQPIYVPQPSSRESSQPSHARVAVQSTPFPRQKRTRAFMLGASVALVLVVAGISYWLQQPPPQEASLPMPQAPKRPAAQTAPSALLADQLEAEPALAAPPSERAADMVIAPEEALPPSGAVANPSTSEAETTTLAPKLSPQTPSTKKSSKVSRGSGLKVVPGDRTKGLSVDDF